MALFRRHRDAARGDGPSAAGIARFWSWWDLARDRIEKAITDGDQAAAGTLLDPHLQPVHPRLAWSVGAGVESGYLLVVSGRHDPALRSIAERWRRAGPVDDHRWEYHPAAPAQPAAFDGLVDVGAVRIDPAQAMAKVQLDDQRCRADLSIQHPRFADLDATTSSLVARLQR